MSPVDTGGKRKYRREYIAVDLKNKEVCMVKGMGDDITFLGVIHEGDARFNKLTKFWQEYCRIAWEKMGA